MRKRYAYFILYCGLTLFSLFIHYLKILKYPFSEKMYSSLPLVILFCILTTSIAILSIVMIYRMEAKNKTKALIFWLVCSALNFPWLIKSLDEVAEVIRHN